MPTHTHTYICLHIHILTYLHTHTHTSWCMHDTLNTKKKCGPQCKCAVNVVVKKEGKRRVREREREVFGVSFNGIL